MKAMFRALLAPTLAAILGLGATGISATVTDQYDAALHHPGRSKEDITRDTLDHPAEMLRLMHVGSGMRVADVLAGDGYYSELVSYIVGPTGHVLLINNAAFDEFSNNGWKKRLAGDRLPNVEHQTVDIEKMGLGKETLDAVFLIKVYHDLYWRGPDGPWPKFSPDAVLNQIVDALKPGGRLLLVDHSAKSGTAQSQAGVLHRIDEAFARKDFESRGLTVIAESQLLRSPADARDDFSYKGPMLGKTDRFVLIFVKRK